jgi:hypothetical protein
MEAISAFFANGDNWILFILPLVVMTVLILVIKPFLPPESHEGQSERLVGFNDMHREAYIAALVAAAVSVVAFEIKGGPEPFVLIWKPLLGTVMVLPFGYALGLIIGRFTGQTRAS